jgi:hypothetical protein
MRPGGEPARLAAGARTLAAVAWALDGAAAALRRATGDLAGGWRGPAATAFAAASTRLQEDLRRTTVALQRAGGGAGQLAARLDAAQALWEQARALAARSGVPFGDAGPWRAQLPPTAAQAAASARVAELAGAAAGTAADADRAAAACFVAATVQATPRAVSDAARALLGSLPGAPRSAPPAEAAPLPLPAAPAAVPHPPAGRRAARGAHRPLPWAALAWAALAVRTVGRVASTAGARTDALQRALETSDDPAVRTGAASALGAVDIGWLRVLPTVGPLLGTVQGVAGGEPLPRAAVRALAGAAGGDAGQRLGLAACGAETLASEGAGALLCPALALAGGVAGETLGEQLAGAAYDRITGRSAPAVRARARTRAARSAGRRSWPGSRRS